MHVLWMSARDTWKAMVLWLLIAMAVPACAGLELRLSSSQTTCLVDEPFRVTVSIINSGSEQARIVKHLAPEYELLSVQVQPPGENFRPCQVGGHINWRPGTSTCQPLPAGEKCSTIVNMTEELLDGKLVNVLSKPGEYGIRAVYEIPERLGCGPLKLSSNVLRVTALDPEGVDRDAHRILVESLKDGPMWSYKRDRDQWYRQLIAEYPESRYAIYARFYLAGFLDTSPKVASALKEAVGLYNSIVDKVGDSEFGVRVLRNAARALAILGETQKAHALLDRAAAMRAFSTDDKKNLASAHKRIDERYGCPELAIN